MLCNESLQKEIKSLDIVQTFDDTPSKCLMIFSNGNYFLLLFLMFQKVKTHLNHTNICLIDLMINSYILLKIKNVFPPQTFFAVILKFNVILFSHFQKISVDFLGGLFVKRKKTSSDSELQ